MQFATRSKRIQEAGEVFIATTLLVYLSLKALFLATQVAPGMAPDEMRHIQLVEIYAQSAQLLPIFGSWNPFVRPLPDFVRFGPVVEFAPLYHLMLGKLCRLLHLDVFDFQTIIFLRILNLLISLANLLLLFSLFRQCLPSFLERLLAYTIVTNLMTFTLLAGSVSYDPLINLLCTSSIIVFIQFVHTHDSTWAFLLVLFTSLGILVKWIMIPFAAIFGCFWAVEVLRGNLLAIKKSQAGKQTFSAGPRLLIIVTSTLVFGITLTLVASKYIKYQHLLAACEEIYSESLCEGYDEDLRAPRLDPEVKISAMYPLYWLYYMIGSSVGIRSYIGVTQPSWLLILYELMLVYALVRTCGKWYAREATTRYLLILTLAYGSMIMYYNYIDYRVFLDAEYGVNGRYAFPILGPLIIFLVPPSLALISVKRRTMFMGAIIFLIMWLEFPLLVLSDAGRGFLSHPPEAYYKLLPNYPNPVYDRTLNRIE